MGTIEIVFIIFLIHLISSLVLYILMKTRLISVSPQLFPLFLFMPVWGALMVINAQWCNRHNLAGSKEFDIERLTLLDNDYRTIHLVDDESENAIVPLEEAFFLNDAATRRKMMIDILHQDPKQYVTLLQRARLNDDIEVTHYASTAIMEVQREYEIEIQRCERMVLSNPESITAIEECINAYRLYIESGLVADYVLSIQRLRYRDIIRTRVALPGADRQHYFNAIDNLIELDDLSAAHDVLEHAIKKWPQDEQAWILQIKYYYKKNDRDMVQHVLSQMQSLYLSPTGRDYIAFWNK